MRVNIRFATSSVEAEIFDTPTGQAIYAILPIRCNVNTWGDEIYFSIPVTLELEAGARSEVSVGDLAYWPNMPAFCIFFGPTPVSKDHSPAAASPVNVFGRLLQIDVQKLSSIPDGENVVVEAVV
jgi:hypothetical protein